MIQVASMVPGTLVVERWCTVLDCTEIQLSYPGYSHAFVETRYVADYRMEI